jgi:uncharacterized repeat protein (TIGR03803 family)
LGLWAWNLQLDIFWRMFPQKNNLAVMRPLYYALSLVVVLSSWIEVSAQTKIYGTTSEGGAQGAGVLYSMNTDGTNYQVLYSFQNAPDGVEPLGKLVPGPGGRLYGFTPLGGASGHGTIFSWDTAAGVYQKLIDLDSVHAADAVGDPLFFNGKLYGLGSSGGAGNFGTIFSYDLAADTLADVFDFSPAVGAAPSGNITVWNNIFFFEASSGAAFNYGCLMSYDPAAKVATDLFDFGDNSMTGAVPGNLLLYNNMLYGTTVGGGGSRLGCIFSLDPRTGAVQDLWNFVSYYWGQYPGALTEYNGKLYGIGNSGGYSGAAGCLYSLDLNSFAFTKLYDWEENQLPSYDGANPVGPVAIDSTGNIYGQTSAQGANGAGDIYNYNINTGAYNVLFYFDWIPTGGGPRSGFILQ